MANTYKVLKDKQQEEVNAFPMVFAFNEAQLKEGLVKLGLKETDKHKVTPIWGGGFCRTEDKPLLGEMTNRHYKELQEAINADETGEGFIFDMFLYELANHEYGYTRDVSDTLDALALTEEEVHGRVNLLNGLTKARANF